MGGLFGWFEKLLSHLKLCLVQKESLNLGPTMPDLGIFGIKRGNNIIKPEYSFLNARADCVVEKILRRTRRI